jgi:hypothetical protein
MKIFKRGSMMQEHRQQQASVGQTPFHFWHMLKMFEFFESLDAQTLM